MKAAEWAEQHLMHADSSDPFRLEPFQRSLVYALKSGEPKDDRRPAQGDEMSAIETQIRAVERAVRARPRSPKACPWCKEPHDLTPRGEIYGLPAVRDRFVESIGEFGRLLLGELRASQQPWAIGCALAWIGVVIVALVR